MTVNPIAMPDEIDAIRRRAEEYRAGVMIMQRQTGKTTSAQFMQDHYRLIELAEMLLRVTSNNLVHAIAVHEADERCVKANETLLEMAGQASVESEEARLRGKAEGVLLALSYFREATR